MGPKWLPKWAHNGPQMVPKWTPKGSQTGSRGGPGGELRVRSVLYPLPGPLGGLLGPDWGDLGGVLGGSGGPFGALGGDLFEAHFQGRLREGFGSDFGTIWSPESGPRWVRRGSRNGLQCERAEMLILYTPPNQSGHVRPPKAPDEWPRNGSKIAVKDVLPARQQ